MAAAIFVIPFAALLLWLFAIRPYCRRNGKGYTTGANVGVTFWVDWQEAKEMAAKNNDQGMILICRIVLWLHALGFAIIAYSIFSPFPR